MVSLRSVGRQSQAAGELHAALCVRVYTLAVRARTSSDEGLGRV